MGKEIHAPQIVNKSSVLDLMSALQASLNSYIKIEETKKSKTKRISSAKQISTGTEETA
ncbi:hypothetical protein [Paenibacillus periandrae]|uniref:hypothetical protein n=1 Tax=Paenibacillus periandrae TaxID=1761741 RepID=UPI0030841F02